MKPRLMSPIVLMLTLCCLLGIEGCANIPTGLGSSSHAHSNKISIGNETIYVRAKELDRYTCGSQGTMQCQFFAGTAVCSCYRRGGFF